MMSAYIIYSNINTLPSFVLCLH